jgi:hypothetical protein
MADVHAMPVIRSFHMVRVHDQRRCQLYDHSSACPYSFPSPTRSLKAYVAWPSRPRRFPVAARPSAQPVWPPCGWSGGRAWEWV